MNKKNNSKSPYLFGSKKLTAVFFIIVILIAVFTVAAAIRKTAALKDGIVMEENLTKYIKSQIQARGLSADELVLSSISGGDRFLALEFRTSINGAYPFNQYRVIYDTKEKLITKGQFIKKEGREYYVDFQKSAFIRYIGKDTFIVLDENGGLGLLKPLAKDSEKLTYITSISINRNNLYKVLADENSIYLLGKTFYDENNSKSLRDFYFASIDYKSILEKPKEAAKFIKDFPSEKGSMPMAIFKTDEGASVLLSSMTFAGRNTAAEGNAKTPFKWFDKLPVNGAGVGLIDSNSFKIWDYGKNNPEGTSSDKTGFIELKGDGFFDTLGKYGVNVKQPFNIPVYSSGSVMLYVSSSLYNEILGGGAFETQSKLMVYDFDSKESKQIFEEYVEKIMPVQSDKAVFGVISDKGVYILNNKNTFVNIYPETALDFYMNTEKSFVYIIDKSESVRRVSLDMKQDF